MVRVRVKDKRLQATYGSYMHRPLHEAVKGQKKGIWEIVDGEDNEILAGLYETREMMADRHGEGYMTKSSFRRPEGRSGLTRKDVFGDNRR